MKKKYRVHGILAATVYFGEYEADSEEEAEVMAGEDDQADWSPTLCHHCANRVDLNEVYELQIEEVT